MALTFQKQPQELMPVYNPVIIVATSSFQTEKQFQLSSTIVCRGETISSLKTPVNPEGYILIDIGRHLENSISFDFNPGSTNSFVQITQATNSFATYSVHFKNEFIAEWDFIDNFYSEIGGTAYVGFISTETPYFSVGDEIYVQQNEPFTNPEYNGVFQIINITQSGATWSITVDNSWAGDTPVEGGVMTFADKRVTIINETIGIGTTQSKGVFNGVLNWTCLSEWNYDEWDAQACTEVDDECGSIKITIVYDGLTYEYCVPEIGEYNGEPLYEFLSEGEFFIRIRFQDAVPGTGGNPGWYMLVENFLEGQADNGYYIESSAENPPYSTNWLIDEEFWTPDDPIITEACPCNECCSEYVDVTIDGEFLGGEIEVRLNRVGDIFEGSWETYEFTIEKIEETWFLIFDGDQLASIEGTCPIGSWTPIEYVTTVSSVGNPCECDWGKFFTNAPQCWGIDQNSYMFLNMYQNAANEIKTVRVKTNLGTYSINNPHTTISPNAQNRFLQVDLSPRWMKELGWINSTTKEIEVWAQNNLTTQTIEKRCFKIIRECSPYEAVQIIFLDKMGSFIPYTFTRVNRETKTIGRTEWGRDFGRYPSSVNNWTNKPWGRGMSTLDTDVQENFVLNSNWISEVDGNYLVELMQSPEAYVVKEEAGCRHIMAINLTLQNVERKQRLNDTIINYTLTYKLSVKNDTQRG